MFFCEPQQNDRNGSSSALNPYSVGGIRRKSMGGEKTASGVLFNSNLPTIDEEESSETSVETDDEQDEGDNALDIFTDDKRHDVEVFYNYFEHMLSLKVEICCTVFCVFIKNGSACYSEFKRSRRPKKKCTESETSLCSNGSEDSSGTSNSVPITKSNKRQNITHRGTLYHIKNIDMNFKMIFLQDTKNINKLSLQLYFQLKRKRRVRLPTNFEKLVLIELIKQK